MTIRRKLCKLRRERRWSQQKLAQESGLSMSAYANLERGKVTDPKWSTVVALARALGVPLDAFAEEDAGGTTPSPPDGSPLDTPASP